ncbi:hypothetical protein DY000_02035464 [Brassica cretica]|uniref:Uncharacterized protein n=1 Tax=Brassica cretica TaxID=69181 RepID=A0ABQ7DSD6_BRACR|nr:hypothetical protein DY000_02035464 [Brassica cretica]
MNMHSLGGSHKHECLETDIAMQVETEVLLNTQGPLDKGLMVDQNINPNIPSFASISVAQFPAKKPTRQWAAWTHQEEECFTALRQVGKERLDYSLTPWTYGRHTFWDRYGNTYGFAFGGKHINLYHREETMDPVVPKEEYLSLYSPLCLYNSATFRSEAKLFGNVRFMDVMFVVFPRSYTFLKYYSTASLQTFLILGTALDVSSFHHRHFCALMHLDHYFVGKGNQTIQVKWLCLMESEGTSMALVRLLVIYPTISSPIWWKHKHLNGRLDAFDVIQFVLVYGAYTTVASLELACSTALWSLCIHIRSSAVWPLFHMDVTVPVVVIPSQWLQIGLQWGVFKRKVHKLVQAAY